MPKDRWDDQAVMICSTGGPVHGSGCGSCQRIAAALRSADATGYARGREDAFTEARKHFEARRDLIHVPSGYYAVEGAMAEQDAYDRAADYCDEKARAASAPAPVQPEEKPCPECGGRGEIEVVCRNGDACSMKKEPHFQRCPKCAGSTPSEQIRNEQGEK